MPLFSSNQDVSPDQPALNNGILGYSFDPFLAGGASGAPASGVIAGLRCYTPVTITYSKVLFWCIAAGAGTSPVNCWAGVYGGNPGDARKSVNAADATTAFGTIGLVSVTQTADGGQNLTIPAGSYYYIEILMGTQYGTTAPTWMRGSGQGASSANANITLASQTARSFVTAAGNTTLPTTVAALASQTGFANPYWVGLA